MGKSWLGYWDMLLQWNELSSKSSPSTCLSSIPISFDVLNNNFEQVLWLICKAPLQQEPSCCPRHTRPTLLFQTLTVYHCCTAIEVLDYPDGSTKTVWLYDGNVQYFTTKHIPRFVAAAIILIAGGLFTLLLFLGQWLPHCSKVMKWTRNTKYIGFMDTYHAPFTPKHRYWVGLLLFALIAHNLVTAMAPGNFLPVLSSGVLSVGLHDCMETTK